MRSNARWRSGISAYLILAGLVLLSGVLAIVLDSTSFGLEFDKYAYDFLFRAEQPPPWQPGSIILAIDERTLAQYGGQSGIRAALADGLDRIRPARPAAVAVDVILAEPGTPEADAKLERAFAGTRNLVLASYVLPDGTWNDPIERFRRQAVAIGQVHADFDRYDSVSRDIPLAKAAGHDRRWALAFDAFLAARGLTAGEESPTDILAGTVRIPTAEREAHVIRIRYPPLAMDGIPRVSIADLDREPTLAARFAGKAVFVGETVQAAGDRWMTPYSNTKVMPGIEMNASLYETLARGMFLTDPPLTAVAVACLAFSIAAALIYAFTSGWIANVGALLTIAASQALPAIAFAHSIVWPWLPGTLAAVFATAAGASWRHLLVRRALKLAGAEKTRYQQAMQFVTHEMRTPLTAIQGSSELIGRYASMPEAKRLEMARMINSESKRLARMIETFLSVERFAEGEMELKRDRFPLAELVERCIERARPLAERKQIALHSGAVPENILTGDRELMEYAVYNLLTNAIKYSPPDTTVRVFVEDGKGDGLRLAIEDQGIGMDKKELGHIFEKFYRTKRAEQSGELGTGIGLSIVQRIVAEHGGSIEVKSEPGKGSRFTVILKRAS